MDFILFLIFNIIIIEKLYIIGKKIMKFYTLKRISNQYFFYALVCTGL